MQERYCYKCTSKEDLMWKTKYLSICKPCKRQQAKEYTARMVTGAHKPKRSQVLKDWEVMARKKNSAIARKYA